MSVLCVFFFGGIIRVSFMEELLVWDYFGWIIVLIWSSYES